MKSTPDQHDPDWPRYPETILTFSTKPRVEIDLRDIPSPRAISELAAAGFAAPFAVLTAFDPRGKNLSRAENERRKRDLERRLEASGYTFVHVDACSPDRSHCECSAGEAAAVSCMSTMTPLPELPSEKVLTRGRGEPGPERVGRL